MYVRRIVSVNGSMNRSKERARTSKEHASTLASTHHKVHVAPLAPYAVTNGEEAIELGCDACLLEHLPGSANPNVLVELYGARRKLPQATTLQRPMALLNAQDVLVVLEDHCTDADVVERLLRNHAHRVGQPNTRWSVSDWNARSIDRRRTRRTQSLTSGSC